MRIGLISGEYPPMTGGIATQVHILAGHLAGAGDVVHVLTDIQGTAEIDGVRHHPMVRRWGPGMLWQVRGWAQEHGLDVVNMHYQTAAYGMSPFIHGLPGALRGVALVVTTFHDLRFPYLFPKAGPLRPWIVNQLAQGSVGVVATNQEDAARLRIHNPRTRLIPIGSGIRTGAGSAADARAFSGAGPDEFVLAFFGFANHSKGLDVLLRSLAALGVAGVRARLVMIGERTGSSDPTNTAYQADMERLIEAEGLSERVRWTGYLDDAEVGGYLRSADTVVLPFRDGASYRRSSLTSAIAQAACIVTTTPAVDVPAFKDGVNMRLVPPGDVPALTEALIGLYNRPAMRDTLRAGASELRAVFGWTGIVTAYRSFYREIIESAF